MPDQKHAEDIPQIKAHRGDLAVIETTQTYTLVGFERYSRLEYNLYEVTSVTKGGLAKAVRHCGWDDGTPPQLVARILHKGHVYIIPKDKVNVAAAIQVARDHHWPDHPGQPKSFDTLDEIREALKPVRT